ncbi:MAG: TonB family protein [Bacteroidetes bacterium]|nr:TonB family protein [Bacteroidota bacterium]MCL6097118.1 TonB family protein [Bacteroidota bacterium]
MPGNVSKYVSFSISLLVHSIIFFLFYIAAHNYNPNANGLIEFNLFEESGGSGGTTTATEEPEEKINTSEKKVEEKVKPIAKPAEVKKETAAVGNQSGDAKGTGTGSGTGTGTGKPGISLGIPIIQKPKEEIYFVAVDEMPEPLGGFDEINSKVIIPPQAKQKGISGTVFVLAFIDQYGVVRKTMLTKGIGYGCDEAAMMAVSRTRFRPGKQNEQPVKVQMQIPVSIR